MNSLVRFWSKCTLDKPPYIHPEDLSIVKQKPKLFDIKVRTPRQFVNSERYGRFSDRRFHLSLYPVPYLGRLNTAKIVVLLLNPGCGLSDYVTDYDAEHAQWLKRILRQKLVGAEFPFISLNPKFCWTGGFQWWEKKLRKVLTIIAKEKFNGCYLDAMKYLSKRLACIELVPYHSHNFGGSRLVEEMPSARAAREYVSKVLVPKARRGEIKLIATRKIARWALPKNCKHVVRYEGGLTRSAPLGPNTPGGAAILEKLGLKKFRR